jgi:hypothetical protein
MPYIKTIPPVEATGKLKEIYQSGAGPSSARGKVSMIRQVQSLNPEVLDSFARCPTAEAAGGRLRRVF